MSEKNRQPAPEEQAHTEDERTLSDAEAIKGGAKHVFDEGAKEPRLEFTKEQIKEAKEGKETIKGIIRWQDVEGSGWDDAGDFTLEGGILKLTVEFHTRGSTWISSLLMGALKERKESDPLSGNAVVVKARLSLPRSEFKIVDVDPPGIAINTRQLKDMIEKYKLPVSLEPIEHGVFTFSIGSP